MFESESTRPDLNQFVAHQSVAPVTTTTSKIRPLNLDDNPRAKMVLKPWQKWLLGSAIFLGLVIVLGGLMAFQVYTVAQELKSQAQEVEILARGSYDAFKAQNLPETEAKLQQVQDKFQGVKATYQKLSFYGKIPIIGAYYQDGENALIAAEHGIAAGLKGSKAITPYADVLGFKGEGTFAGGTAENRIKILIETLDKVEPVFDEIIGELTLANEALAKINPQRYPVSFQNKEVRPKLMAIQKTSADSLQMIGEFKPVIQQLPSIAGGKGQRRKYLVLFQNNNELRPTGGFLTAYAVIYVEDGKVALEKSDDIYELDKKFAKKIAIPVELGKYLTTEKYFNLRDMNISPDFKISMDQFFENYQTIKSEPSNVDGIIAIDTEVLKKLVAILGPIEIPGYGTFSAEIDKRCDCPQIVYALSEIITKPTPYLRADRKGILGPMMQTILTKAYGAPKQLWPQLFEMAWQSLEGRNIQMYFMNEQDQAAALAVNAGGRMLAPANGKDFLAIVDANLGGAKSNLFVDYEVKQVVSKPENGQLTKTVEITYRNTRKGDNCNLEAGLLCLNSTLHDWNRLYLPAGTKLIEAKGYTKTAKTYEENGFVVVDGFFNLEPLGTAKLIFTYTVPYADADNYEVTLWKQGGIDQIQVLMDVEGGEEQLTLVKDQVYTTKF
ncbi:MAG TPA: hypothetical protein DEP87_04750 [Candidatus Pacebacteria bacterium]|nr:hypothetical protein [Candidatus Paceibacterota bacterium]